MHAGKTKCLSHCPAYCSPSHFSTIILLLLSVVYRCGSTICLEIYSCCCCCCCNLVPQNWTVGQRDNGTAGQCKYSLSAFELGKQYCTSCSSCKCSISKVKSSRINMQSVYRCVCKLVCVCMCICLCMCVYLCLRIFQWFMRIFSRQLRLA